MLFIFEAVKLTSTVKMHFMRQVVYLIWEVLTLFNCTCVCVCVCVLVCLRNMVGAFGTLKCMHKQNHTLVLSHPHTHTPNTLLPSFLNLYWPWLGQEHSPLAEAQHMGQLKSTSQAQAHTEGEGEKETIALSQAKTHAATTRSESRKGEKCATNR